jgi:predicted exporter
MRRHAAALSPERLRRDWAAAMAMRPDTAPPVRPEYLPLLIRHLERDTTTITVAGLRDAGLGELVARHLVQREGEVLAVAQVYPTAIPWRPGVVERFQRGLAATDPDAFRGVTWVGEALQGASRTTQLRRDVLLACGTALALTLLVLGLRFRRVAPVVLALVPVGCGLATVLGVMAIAGVQLNLITLVAVPVILGLGSDDGIHIVDRLERGEAMTDVVRDTATPMTITTLTTIVGFACLGLARFPDVAAGGVIASLGLLVCLAASLHLLPLLAGGKRETPARGAP